MTDKGSPERRAGHTPGPWKVGTNHPCRIICPSLGLLIGYAIEPEDEGTETETEKDNARLIAAAPDMEIALQDILEWTDAYNGTEDSLLDMRDAIKKIASFALSKTREE